MHQPDEGKLNLNKDQLQGTDVNCDSRLGNTVRIQEPAEKTRYH